jgi:farnesyl diphosphate synthase
MTGDCGGLAALDRTPQARPIASDGCCRPDMTRVSEATFLARLAEVARATDAALDAALGGAPLAGEVVRPPRLLAAMRHAALGGGKRLRPFLVVECAALFGVAQKQALPTAAAFECLHCYSLVHDDLPAMDDDDMRRGRPTVHRAFDEATAILAGDALVTLAFDLLARAETAPDPSVRVALTSLLARAAGVGGMAGGQMLDLEAEGRLGGSPAAPTADEVLQLQAMKTGALFCAACEAGAILGGAAAREREALARYARAFGLAFQIADDLIDAEGEPTTAGKRVGKDRARGKATTIAVLGMPGTRARLAELVNEAEGALAPFAARGHMLAAAARFAGGRNR